MRRGFYLTAVTVGVVTMIGGHFILGTADAGKAGLSVTLVYPHSARTHEPTTSWSTPEEHGKSEREPMSATTQAEGGAVPAIAESESRTAYRTELGEQQIGDSRALLEELAPKSVDLIVTSPPFALIRKKEYGNPDQGAYVNWLAEFGRRAWRVLKETGSLVIDIGGAYQAGIPTRSLYPYQVLIRFCDELGYHLAQDFYWHNPAKLPAPIEWVNKRKIRVKDTVNTIWWLSRTRHPKASIAEIELPRAKWSTSKTAKMARQPRTDRQAASRTSSR